MSRENLCMSYVGQLFDGDKKTKSWTPVIDGQVAVHLRQREGGAWWIIASKKPIMWEKHLDASFKHCIKENFVQWQNKFSDGEDAGMFGLRFKNGNIAKQFGETIDIILTPSLEGTLSSFSPVSSPSLLPESQVSGTPSTTEDKLKEGREQVLLKVHIADEEEGALKVPRNMPLQKIMESVCQEKKLDSTLYVIMQTSGSSPGKMLECQPGTSVGDLCTCEVTLMLKDYLRSTETSASGIVTRATTGNTQSNGESEREDDKEEDLMLLQVELPKSEHTVIRVSPSISMEKLLIYVCEKRNMDPTRHHFYLPASANILEGRTLQDLKIDKIMVITKEITTQVTTPSKTPRTPDDTSSSSPTRSKSKRGLPKCKTSMDIKCVSGSPSRVAPLPPLQRRRTQPDLIKELATEMVERKMKVEKERTEEDEVAGGSAILDPNETEFASDQWSSITAGKDLSSHKRMEDEERATLEGETVDGIPEVSRSTFRSKKILKHRTTPPPLVPSQNATPTTPDGNITPSFPLKRDAKETFMGVDRPKKHAPPPPPSANGKSQMKPSPKQKKQIGLEEHGANIDGGGEVGEMRGVAQVKIGMAGIEASITSALIDQAGSRLGRCSTKVKRKDAIGDQIREDTSHHHRSQVVRTPPKKLSLSATSTSELGTSDIAAAVSSETRAREIPNFHQKRKVSAPVPPPHSQIRSTSEGEDGSQRVETRRHSEEKPSSASKEAVKGRTVSNVCTPGGVHGSSRGERGKTKKPHRKAPCRPPPSIPAIVVPLMEEKEDAEVFILKAEEDTIPATPITKPHELEMSMAVEVMDSNLPHPLPSTLDFQLSNFPSDPHAEVKISTNRTPQNSAATVTVCKDTIDGGKLLIIRPSPGSTHKTQGSPIIFKLPPPPPQPPISSDVVPSGVGDVIVPDVLPYPTSPEGEVGGKTMWGKKTTTPSKSGQNRQKKEKSSEVPSGKAWEVTRDTILPTPSETLSQREKDQGRVKEEISILPLISGGKKRQQLVKQNKTDETSPSPSRHYSISETFLEQDSINSDLSTIVSPGGGLLNANIIRDKYTDLNILRPYLHDEFMTSNLSREKNREPPKVEQLDSGSGMRVSGTGISTACLNNTSMSDSDSSHEDGYQVLSMDEADDNELPTKTGVPNYVGETSIIRRTLSNQSSPCSSPKDHAGQNNKRSKSLSNQRSPRRSLGKQMRPSFPVPLAGEVSLLHSKNSNNNNSSMDTMEGARMGNKPTRVEELYPPPAKFEGGNGQSSDSLTSSASEVNSSDNCGTEEGGVSLFSGSPDEQSEEEEHQVVPGVTDGRIQERCVCPYRDGSTRDCYNDGVVNSENEEVEYERDTTSNKLDNIVADSRNLVECSSDTESAISVATSDEVPSTAPLSNIGCSHSLSENSPYDLVDLYSLNSIVSDASTPTPLGDDSDLTPPTFVSDEPPSQPSSPPPSLIPPTPPIPVLQSSSGPVVERHCKTLPFPPSTSPPLSHTPTCTDDELAAKKPPPLSAKPASRFRMKSNELNSAKDELFQKLKERQEKLKVQAASNSNEKEPSKSEGQENLQSDSKSEVKSNSNSVSDDVQMQLQFLQQQVIQQQMHLHQFQHLLAMNPGISVPGMGNMGMGSDRVGMPMPGIPHAMMEIPGMSNIGSRMGNVSIGMNPGNLGMNSVEVDMNISGAGMNSDECMSTPGAGMNSDKEYMSTPRAGMSSDKEYMSIPGAGMNPGDTRMSSDGVGVNIPGMEMNPGNMELSSGGVGMNIPRIGMSGPGNGVKSYKSYHTNNRQILSDQLHLLSPIQPVMASQRDPVLSYKQQQTVFNGQSPVKIVSLITTKTSVPPLIASQCQLPTLQNDLHDAGEGVTENEKERLQSKCVSKWWSKAMGEVTPIGRMQGANLYDKKTTPNSHAEI